MALIRLRSHLPQALYSAEQTRALDRLAIEQCGIPGISLMERAGEAVFTVLREHWPEARRIAVVCGTGNNGGDGYIVARLVYLAGLEPRVLSVGSKPLQGDALLARQRLEQAGIMPETFAGERLADVQVIVDALFGTGLDREVEGEYKNVIDAINRTGLPVLAVDIPSGLHADTGRILGCAITAATTVSFIGVKPGLLTGNGPACTGTVCFDDLSVPGRIYDQVSPIAQRLDYENTKSLFPRRSRTAHKGNFGHVLVIGGDHGYAGAACMAATASARVGTGLVSLATRASHAGLITLNRLEIMSHPVESTTELLPLLNKATVVAIGPGLGQSDWARQMLSAVVALEIPLVVDADALNLLAVQPHVNSHWVLTPHPGEAARLLGLPTTTLQQDRFTAVTAIRQRYGGVCVLKGAGTLIAGDKGPPALCSGGNPGMATGGMGDVLTGIIAGLLAQGFSLADAATAGVSLHAQAADRAADEGERGLLATDLLPWLRPLVNP